MQEQRQPRHLVPSPGQTGVLEQPQPKHGLCAAGWRAAVAIAIVGAAAVVSAAEREITIRDYTGWGYAPDLVQYSIARPGGGGESLRLVGPDGNPVAIQVTPPAAKGQPATLSFVAELPPSNSITYRLRDDGQGGQGVSTLKVAPAGKDLELTTAVLGLRVPVPFEKTYDPPVAANTLPAPVLAFRNGSGPWLGESRILCTRPVKAARVRQIAAGPVFAAIRYELEFANGGYYHADIRVADGVPLAQVTEEYDLKELNGRDYWELDLGKGWNPDMVEAVREGRAALSIADLIKKRPVPGTKGSAGQVLGADLPDLAIVPGYCWVGQGAYYVGLWAAAERQAKPEEFTRVCFMPLHKGQWRMMNACEFRTDGRAMRIRLPMSARLANWHEDGASFTSPFSIAQHDPNLPRTAGRRVWGLVLASVAPAWRAQAATPGGYSVPWSTNTPPLFWRMRNEYGTFGLDQYKDFILEWPDTGVKYPRVFLTPTEQEQYKAMLTNQPIAGYTQSLAHQVKSRWGFTGDPKVAQHELEEFQRWMLNQTRGYLDTSPAIGHHDLWGWYETEADDLLGWPDLPAAARAEIRARLALVAYMWTDPDLMSAGTGDHTGNPNMSCSRQMSFANFMALLPDHPMHETWKQYMSDFTLYKIGETVAPGGGPFEFGSAYGLHLFYAFPRGYMGHAAGKSPCAGDLYQHYLAPGMDYFVNLLTPVDSRYGSRLIPGGANSMLGYNPRWIEWVGVAEKTDPALASELAWAFEAQGRSEDINVGVALETMDRPWVKPVEPKLTSRIYPGVGVVFRAHQGPDETYMYFRSGNNWSHWYVDQGHFLLNSKGAVLVPSQPYQYYWPTNKAFDVYNAIRFGHPENEFPYAWPDSNILDHHFGDSVDYAWASAGYPDWYIAPGMASGFGDPRKLIDGAAPQGGGFHWNRQILFLKGATARSPNYFVFRDTMVGAGKLPSWLSLDLLGRKTDIRQDGNHVAVNTEWPTKLDLVFQPQAMPKLEMAEDDINVTCQWGDAFWRLNADKTNASPNWMLKDGSPVKMPLKMWQNPGILEKRVLLRFANAPGAESFWLLYPRGEREALPTTKYLAPGVMKIVTTESTDYAFVSPSNFTFAGEDVVFSGCAGAVRVGKESVTLVLNGGAGRVGYKGHIIESPVPFEKTIPLVKLKPQTEKLDAPRSAVRIEPTLKEHRSVAPGVAKATADGVTELLVDNATPVQWSEGGAAIEAAHALVSIASNAVHIVVPTREYAQITAGTLGVRGVGPFDLVLTPDAIRGVVDGDTRTLVVTRPSGILRPMYQMDGLRYYAGFADDSTPDKSQPTPQFNLAFGVTDGPHQIEVAEWIYPPLPHAVARKAVE